MMRMMEDSLRNPLQNKAIFHHQSLILILKTSLRVHYLTMMTRMKMTSLYSKINLNSSNNKLYHHPFNSSHSSFLHQSSRSLLQFNSNYLHLFNKFHRQFYSKFLLLLFNNNNLLLCPFLANHRRNTSSWMNQCLHLSYLNPMITNQAWYYKMKIMKEDSKLKLKVIQITMEII